MSILSTVSLDLSIQLRKLAPKEWKITPLLYLGQYCFAERKITTTLPPSNLIVVKKTSNFELVNNESNIGIILINIPKSLPRIISIAMHKKYDYKTLLSFWKANGWKRTIENINTRHAYHEYKLSQDQINELSMNNSIYQIEPIKYVERKRNHLLNYIYSLMIENKDIELEKLKIIIKIIAKSLDRNGLHPEKRSSSILAVFLNDNNYEMHDHEWSRRNIKEIII